MASNTELISNSPNQELVIKSIEQPTTKTTTQVLQQVPPGKHQVLPVVYIQTQPPTKNTNIIASSNNVILNPVSQLHLPSLAPMPNPSQSLLLGKQPIVLQKAQSLPKNGVTYLTMLKPVSKPPDTILANSKLTTISKIKADTLQKYSTTTNQTPQGKIVIAPMPKMTTNRLPVTATTNTVQPKISFMPAGSTTTPILCNIKIDDNVGETDNIEHTNTDTTIETIGNTTTMSSIGEVLLITNPNTTSTTPVVVTETTKDALANEKPKMLAIQHGVSILKKTYNSTESAKQSEGTVQPLQPTDTPIVTVSDAETKEVKLGDSTEEAKPKKSETVPQKRSRKSTLCLRKDFHEIETIEEGPRKKVPRIDASEVRSISDMEVDSINSNNTGTTKLSDWTFNFDENFADLLAWDDGIGSLPESDLKFFVNEFGFLEYLTKYEYRRMTYKKQLKQVKETRKETQEEMRCLECGCFGMATEFISPKYCSAECQTAHEKKSKRLEWKKSVQQQQQQNNNVQSTLNSNNNPNNNGNNKKNKENGESIKQLTTESTDEEVVDVPENHQDMRHPWDCKRGFSWPKYLNHVNAISAPERLFKDPFPYTRNGFRQGMKLEGIDPRHPSHFGVFSVAVVQGYRMQLHCDGYPPSTDFWINADSMDIFPVGFCEKYGRSLRPPPKIKNWNWTSYLKFTKSSAAPKQLFANRTGHAIFPSGFRIGMKLEAVDRKNSSLICVATVKDLIDYRLLVHFDSWDDIYDYWADPSSPYIHPVGWCEKNGHKLTPPNDYHDRKNFKWEKYLEETGTQAAPVRAFKQRPASGFKKGMRIECVDKRVPQLIRVATVDEVRGHRLRVSFDGWPKKYSYWVDDDNPNIHPAGWAQKTGHVIEPPLTPDDVYDSYGCPTIGCKGVGNIKGPMFATHTQQKFCPYSDENLDLENDIPEKIYRRHKNAREGNPSQKESKSKTSKDSSKKYETDETKTEWLEEQQPQSDEDDKAKIHAQLGIATHSSTQQESSSPSNRKCKNIRLSLLEDSNPQDVKMRERHSKYLQDFVEFSNKFDPKRWTCAHVSDFVGSLPFVVKDHTDQFATHRIDGESFLMLNQQDLIEVMNFKLGPAIALYNCIILLRKNVVHPDCS